MDTLQTITIPGAKPGYYWPMKPVLQWDQPFYTSSGVTSDFDVLIKNAAGTTAIASGITDNVATQQPIEVVSWDASGSTPTQYTVAVQHKGGATNARLKYLLIGPDGTTIDEFASHSGTVHGHPAADGAIAVGAVPYYAPDTIEPFSSRGDVTIYFDAAGNRLPTPQVRQKPDVVAPDNVNTTFFGTDIPQDPDTKPNFAGTSAAAPHVAGVVALILDANPHLTRGELYDAVTSTTVDLGTPGRDPVYGFGRVDASAAVTVGLATPDVTPPTATMTSPIPVHGWNVDHIDVRFSEPLTPAIATNAANFALIGAGEDSTFGTSDDVSYTVAVAYNADSRTNSLIPTAPSTTLSVGRYRLTLNATNGLADEAGNALNSGTDQRFDFEVAAESQIVSVEAATNIDIRPDGSAVLVYPSNPILDHRSWPQVMVGEFDSGGSSTGPFRSAPTDMEWSYSVNNPDVAVNANGGVATFSDHTSIQYGPDDYVIGFWVLDSQARPVGERQVAVPNAFGKNGGPVPRVEMNETGQFVICYDDFNGPNDEDELWIKARLFQSNATPAGPEFFVSQRPWASNPVVAIGADGSSVYAWDYNTAVFPDGDSGAVFARRFDASGKPIGDEFRVNATVIGRQINPDIAMAADGSFAIVWSTATTIPVAAGTYLQRYSASGVPVGPETRVSPANSNSRIAMAPDGRFVVVWCQDDGDGKGNLRSAICR